MRILFVASEAYPLVKVGGLADVVGSLPKALGASGHDVRILIPQYSRIDTLRFPLTPVLEDVKFSLPGETLSFNLNRTSFDGVPVYTLESREYFDHREIYTGADLDRFYFFSRAVVELLSRLDWQPDIVHCHDWHTSLIVMWLKKSGYPCASVFTIHNLAHQGLFDETYLSRRNLKKDWDFFPPAAPRPPLSFMGQAILWADMVTTVSDTYAREITTPQMGMGLDHLLRYRQDSLTGIVNGLDYREWDPQTDPLLPVNYSSVRTEIRSLNKTALQRVAGLPVNGDIPLIGLVQRLDGQKGMDILVPAMELIIRETGARFVILGKGWDSYEQMLRELASRFPENISVFIAFEEPLAHLIYGGCDMFLMPSQFEPCGLGQLIAMRYGALPVVRHTGGLVDTVPKFSPGLKEGHGFIFHEYSSGALIAAVREAVEAFKDKLAWARAVRRVMEADFSWQHSARLYENVYQRVTGKGAGEGDG